MPLAQLLPTTVGECPTVPAPHTWRVGCRLAAFAQYAHVELPFVVGISFHCHPGATLTQICKRAIIMGWVVLFLLLAAESNGWFRCSRSSEDDHGNQSTRYARPRAAAARQT